MARRSVPGAYVAGASVLHRLDPRVKLALLAAWTVGMFCMGAWWANALVLATVLLLARACKVPMAAYLRTLAPACLVLAFMLVAATVRLDGTGDVVVAGALGVSAGGFERGAASALRIVALVATSLLFTATTSPTALVETLLWVLGPLRALGVAVEDVATVVSIAIRFVPVCAEQFERVATAQRARGARLGEGSPRQKVVSWFSVLMPLFVGLFRRSEALAQAMAARMYRGAGRTSLTVLKLRAFDVAVLVAGCAACVALAMLV